MLRDAAKVGSIHMLGRCLDTGVPLMTKHPSMQDWVDMTNDVEGLAAEKSSSRCASRVGAHTAHRSGCARKHPLRARVCSLRSRDR
jgi:hypothetical protein